MARRSDRTQAAVERMRRGADLSAVDATLHALATIPGFLLSTQRASGLGDALDAILRAHDEADVLEINVLLTSIVALTRDRWTHVAEVDTRYDPSHPRVCAGTWEVTRACVHFVLDTARAIAERDGGLPVRPGRILIQTARRNRYVDVTVATDGFRHVLQLPAAD